MDGREGWSENRFGLLSSFISKLLCAFLYSQRAWKFVVSSWLVFAASISIIQMQLSNQRAFG